MPPELAAAAHAFAAAVLLAFASAALERFVAGRAAGLRRPRGLLLLLQPVADALKLLGKARTAGNGARTAAAVVALLPAAALAGAAAGDPSVLLPAGIGGALRPIALVALTAAATLALLAPAAAVCPARRRPLAECTGALVGAQVAVALAAAALVADGSPAAASPAAAEQVLSWPLWRHPLGAAACVGALAVVAPATAAALGAGALAPGLVGGAGAAAAILYLARHLLLGGVALLVASLYCGAQPGGPWTPAGLVLAPPFLAAAFLVPAFLAAAFLAAASVEDRSPEGLAWIAWTRLAPLALADVALSAALTAGLPWT